MNSLKPFLTRTSPIVVSHIEQFLEDIPDLEPGNYVLTPRPKSDLSEEQCELFWRYHGHFKQEFVRAVCNILPHHTQMVEYDHLNNSLTVKVTS